jgi:hypothetical protein
MSYFGPRSLSKLRRIILDCTVLAGGHLRLQHGIWHVWVADTARVVVDVELADISPPTWLCNGHVEAPGNVPSVPRRFLHAATNRSALLERWDEITGGHRSVDRSLAVLDVGQVVRLAGSPSHVTHWPLAAAASAPRRDGRPCRPLAPERHWRRLFRRRLNLCTTCQRTE